MNNKGQQQNIGLLIMVAVAVIVGGVLMVAVATDVSRSTNTISVTDVSVTAGANGASVDIDGQELIDTPTVVNSSSYADATANFAFTELVSNTTGVKTISMQTLNASYASQTVLINYTLGPDGYIDNSGGRSVTTLILIFMALGIAIIALVPVIKSGALSMK